MSDERASATTARAAQGDIAVHAVLLGERLNTAGLDREGLLTGAPMAYRVGERGLVALFRYGVAVLFGLSADDEASVLESLAPRVIFPEPRIEDETAAIAIEPGADDIVAPSGAVRLREPSIDRLLIVADALAKSVALARDEREVAAVFEAMEPHVASLAASGRTGPARRGITRLIGQALLVQQRVSGRVAVREKPDVLWDRPELERLYNRLEDEYELVERAEALDRKLAAVAAAATALLDLKDADRSLRLELIIILLILAELVLGVAQWAGRGR